jgi:uncharacterized membrane protein YheB (UPF0754 family)
MWESILDTGKIKDVLMYDTLLNTVCTCKTRPPVFNAASFFAKRLNEKGLSFSDSEGSKEILSLILLTSFPEDTCIYNEDVCSDILSL